MLDSLVLFEGESSYLLELTLLLFWVRDASWIPCLLGDGEYSSVFAELLVNPVSRACFISSSKRFFLYCSSRISILSWLDGLGRDTTVSLNSFIR